MCACVCVSSKYVKVVYMHYKSLQIKKSDVDFSKSGNTSELMKQKHDRKIYPPQIIITVASKVPGIDPVVKFPVTFQGSSSDEDLDQDIILPLGIHNSYVEKVNVYKIILQTCYQ